MGENTHRDRASSEDGRGLDEGGVEMDRRGGRTPKVTSMPVDYLPRAAVSYRRGGPSSLGGRVEARQPDLHKDVALLSCCA